MTFTCLRTKSRAGGRNCSVFLGQLVVRVASYEQGTFYFFRKAEMAYNCSRKHPNVLRNKHFPIVLSHLSKH